MARIAGVKYLGVAKITNGSMADITNVTYGNLKEIPQFISFSGSENKAESSWYSNDKTEETFSQITDVDLEAVVGKLSNELNAEFSGATYSGGVMTVKSADKQAEYGMLVIFDLMGNNGGQLAYFYQRCKLGVTSVEGETKTDSITDSPMTITGKAIPIGDGSIMSQIMDTANLKTADAFFTEFKKKVVVA